MQPEIIMPVDAATAELSVEIGSAFTAALPAGGSIEPTITIPLDVAERLMGVAEVDDAGQAQRDQDLVEAAMEEARAKRG